MQRFVWARRALNGQNGGFRPGQIDHDTLQRTAFPKLDHPVDVAARRGARLLTADFRAGDLVLFNMFTLHGSIDNNSPAGRGQRWAVLSFSCSPLYFI